MIPSNVPCDMLIKHVMEAYLIILFFVK